MASLRQRSIALYRGLLQELRYTINSGERGSTSMPWKNSPMYAVISKGFQDGIKLTSAEDIAKSQTLGDQYLVLLSNVRKGLELEKLYKGHGEKTIERSAAAVGLKLPNSKK